MKKNLSILLVVLSLSTALIAGCTSNSPNNSEVNTSATTTAPASAAPASTTAPVDSKETENIKNLLTSYRDALAASDVSSVVSQYTADGVMMPTGAPTAIGTEQIKAVYEGIFSGTELNLNFSIDEIIVDGDYGIVRSTSKGTALIKATNKTAPEENRELFVVQKVDGEWKIARYIFNKTDVINSATSAKVTIGSPEVTDETEKALIEKQLASYSDALATTNLDNILSVYTDDAVVLPPGSPTAEGKDAIKTTYEGIFSNVVLDLKFNIDEIVLNGDYGFVRTTSSGTALNKATNESGPEENRELFVVQKVNGEWKIARYMFNKTK